MEAQRNTAPPKTKTRFSDFNRPNARHDTRAAARCEVYFTEISERGFGQQNGKVGGSELGIALRF